MSGQQLTITNIGSSGQDGVSLDLGDLDLPGLHPGIQFIAPLAPNDTSGSLLLGPTLGQPRLRLSNLKDASAIDIEILPLDLMSHSPGITLKLEDSTDNIFGGTQIFRLNDSLPRLRLSNLGPDGTRGIEIEILPLDLVSSGPAIHFVQDPLIPDQDHLRFLSHDTFPGFSIHSRTATSSSFTWGDLHGPLLGPSITFDFLNIPLDSTPLIRLEPDRLRDHLVISNIGSSGCDGVSIDLGETGLLPLLPGPSLDLIRPIPMTNHETSFVFVFTPLDTTPSLTLGNTGLGGQDGIRLETPKDLYLFSLDSSLNSSLRLDNSGDIRLNADKGLLTVSNIGSSGEDGVSIELGNTKQDSTARFEYDANQNMIRIVNPSRYVFESDTGLTTTYVYDAIDRRIRREMTDDFNPGNDVVFEYDFNTRRYRVEGLDTSSTKSDLGLETRYVYDGFDRVIREDIKPADTDTFRRTYFYDDNTLRYHSLDTLSFSNTGSLCYGHRFFEPGKSVSVDILNKSNGRSISTLYDLNSRSCTLSGANRYSYFGSGGLNYYCDLTYTPNRFTFVYLDTTTSSSMQCIYDPNAHSMSCHSVSSYLYSTSNLSCRSSLSSSAYARTYLDTTASRSMTCTHTPSLYSMSCSNYDSTTYQSSNNMRCTSVFDNTNRLYMRSYDDLADGNPPMRCVMSCSTNTRSCSNISFYTSVSPSNLICESDHSTNLRIDRTMDGNGAPGNGIEVLKDPNAAQMVVQGVGGANGNLHVQGNLSKLMGSFKIDHPLDPENKYLYHSFVESPDMMNVYNGNITTDAKGYATVQLPDYFEELNIEFRYQLTVIGVFAQAIVKEKINNNKFVIQTDQPNIEVSWQVTGIRNDQYARDHRLEVEVEKAEGEKGTLLYSSLD